MQNYSIKKLFLDLVILLEIFTTVAIASFLLFVIILINSLTDALGDFTTVVIKPFG